MDTESVLKQIRGLVSDGDIDAAVAMLEENDVDIDYRDVTHDLQTLLMRLCYYKLSVSDYDRVLAAIFDKSPDVNVQDSWGRTFLMHACIANKPVCVEGLLSYEGTDVTIADFDGNTALSYAVQNCDIYTMEDILSHKDGGSLVVKHNAKGQSPLTIARKSGDKSVINLFESYINKSVCLQEKKKQRKPRNRDIIRLPQPYTPSPERKAQDSSPRHMSNRSLISSVASKSLPQSPARPVENYFSPRRKNEKLDLNLEKVGKSDSAPLLRKDIAVPNADDHNLALTSARLSRHHFKRDCLTNYSCSLESPQALPYLTDNENSFNRIPDNHLRRQRRPSISLPDLRMAGFLVQSGSSSPSSESESKDLSCCEGTDNDDDVFAQRYPNRRVFNNINSPKHPEKQLTLPEINQSRSCQQSPSLAKKNISPLARSRKYSNSDDHLNRIAVSQVST